jgi:hypothetical protein
MNPNPLCMYVSRLSQKTAVEKSDQVTSFWIVSLSHDQVTAFWIVSLSHDQMTALLIVFLSHARSSSSDAVIQALKPWQQSRQPATNTSRASHPKAAMPTARA